MLRSLSAYFSSQTPADPQNSSLPDATASRSKYREVIAKAPKFIQSKFEAASQNKPVARVQRAELGVGHPLVWGLKQTKRAPSLQVNRAVTQTELIPPSAESNQAFAARQRMRYMAGGRVDFIPQDVAAAPTAALIRSALRTDRGLLGRYERVVAPGALLYGQRSELEHMARYGLSCSIRDRADQLLNIHDPYLRQVLRRGTSQVLARAALASRSAVPSLAVAVDPCVRLVQESKSGSLEEPPTPAIAQVTAANGATYLVAEPNTRGASKSFSVGLTQSGTAVGVLIMRGPGGRDVFDVQTAELDLSTIAEEIKNLSAFSDDFEIHDAFPVDDTWYVVVPLFDAGNAFEAIIRMPQEERSDASIWFLPDWLQLILDLHKKYKALHKDMKLQNILCTTSGRVVLADFGMTTKLNPYQAVNDSFGGTFFAPEQVYGMHLTPAVDFWSLGASLGDLIVPRKRGTRGLRNPHYPVLNKDGGWDQMAHVEQQLLFTKFRAMLFDNETGEGLFEPEVLGALNLSKPMNTSLKNMAGYYKEFYARSPLLAHFCLEHLLEPNPAMRTDEHGELFVLMAHTMRATLHGDKPGAIEPKLSADPKISAAIAALEEALKARQPGVAA